jgi:hypothetical protein
MGMKKAAAAGTAALTIIAGGLVLAGPAGAGDLATATLTVNKVVVGTAPTDAEFTINVYCESEEETPDTTLDLELELRGFAPSGIEEVVYDEDITFGADGGSEDFTFFGPAVCEITEIDDGGASSSTGPVTVFIEDPTEYEATITNTFVSPDTLVPTTSTTRAAVAAVATPRFTG